MFIRRGLAVGAATMGLVALGAPAFAATGDMYGRTCCDPGGASASGHAEFSSRYSVKVTSLKLNDLCPGDGDSVYVLVQYQQQVSGDWVTMARRENHAGCSDPDPTAETSVSYTATSGRMKAVRLRVCVDETFPNNDDCANSNAVSNPYP